MRNQKNNSKLKPTNTYLLMFVISTVAFIAIVYYRYTNQDPEGISRRPPFSMHAHQSEWHSRCHTKIAVQSPISLVTTNLSKEKESPIHVELLKETAEFIDVGHTFQVRYSSSKPGAKATFEGNKFELRQFHFHKPSEHLIDGRQYEMEAHFVFLNQNKKSLPKALVLGVMILDGVHNREIAKIWQFMPPFREGYGETKFEMSDWKEAIQTHELELDAHSRNEKILSRDVNFELAELLPTKADFYIYNGSLTTPDCDEGITHAVALTPIQMHHEQVEHFEGYYEGNNRDIQPTGKLESRNFRRATVNFNSK